MRWATKARTSHKSKSRSVLPGILRTLIVLLPLLIVLAHVGAVHGAQGAPDLMQTLAGCGKSRMVTRISVLA
jgi:hypothetical protein